MSRLDNILDYKKNNPNCDPNLYEMVEVADEMARRLRAEAPNYGIYSDSKNSYLKDSDGNPTELATDIAKLNEVYRINMEALLNNDLGITKESPLYKMMIKAQCNQGTYADSPSYYAKLAGVALYIEQQKRAVRRGEQDKVVYNNSSEIDYLRRKMSPAYSRMLHGGELKSDNYPEFEVYKEVFAEYMRSVPQSEHDYELLAGDWKIYFQLEKKEREEQAKAKDSNNEFITNLQENVVSDDVEFASNAEKNVPAHEIQNENKELY